MSKRDVTDPNRFNTVAVDASVPSGRTADEVNAAAELSVHREILEAKAQAESVTPEDPQDAIVVDDEEAISARAAEAVEAEISLEHERDDEAAHQQIIVHDDVDDVTSLAAMAEGLSIVTPDEVLSYTCGYRAGVQDPGYLLGLAELGRHLGSFFSTMEETAFNRMPAGEWWTRWGLGYSDAVAGVDPRVTLPPKPAEMDW